MNKELGVRRTIGWSMDAENTICMYNLNYLEALGFEKIKIIKKLKMIRKYSSDTIANLKKPITHEILTRTVGELSNPIRATPKSIPGKEISQ